MIEMSIAQVRNKLIIDNAFLTSYDCRRCQKVPKKLKAVELPENDNDEFDVGTSGSQEKL